jgi:hypothetical protein
MFGLLHISENESSTENARSKNFISQIEIYVDCAINLAKSLALNEIQFVLLTNKPEFLNKIIESRSESLVIQEIIFTTKIPHGTRFFSAHHKLDAFRYLASLNDSYVALCDLDVVCINHLPDSFLTNIQQQTPMCYDISDQVIPAYGSDVIIRDLKSIHHQESEGRWSGGEFISGSPRFFFSLIHEIEKIYPSYIETLGSLHHVGDEAIVSAALEIIRRSGTYIADAGTLGIVGRFWSIPVLHTQKRFRYFQSCFLLHLPADKQFLAQLAKARIIHAKGFNICCLFYIRLSQWVNGTAVRRLKIPLIRLYFSIKKYSTV